jgi:hypothetical protein
VAQAKLEQQRREVIDHLLGTLERKWESLPRVEAEIDGWDYADQIDFLDEWAIQEDNFADLEKRVEQGQLTRDQLARYETLRDTIADNRSIIERLQRI